MQKSVKYSFFGLDWLQTFTFYLRRMLIMATTWLLVLRFQKNQSPANEKSYCLSKLVGEVNQIDKT